MGRTIHPITRLEQYLVERRVARRSGRLTNLEFAKVIQVCMFDDADVFRLLFHLAVFETA